MLSRPLSLVIGVLFGAIGHSANRGRRDFTSVSDTRADRYEVQVDDSYTTRPNAYSLA